VSFRFKQAVVTRDRPTIELVPMIDVAIFLLVFFMLFTTFKTNEEGIEIDLPRAATGSEVPPSNLVVSITESGALMLDGEFTTLENFRAVAARVAQANPRATVTIRGDSRSYWEHAVSVMDTARQAGLSQFAIGTQPLNR